VKKRPGLLSLLFLLGAPLVLVFTPHVAEWPRDKVLITGEASAAYEKAFDRNLSIRPFAIATWGVIQYALFGEGRSGVLVGEGGWLYTREEFEQGTGLEANLAEIIRINDELEQNNIRLVVALIPDKSRVYPEHLGHYYRSVRMERRYQGVRERLSSAGVIVPDLLTPLAAAKAEGDVFLHTDTHWTARGAKVAASILAQYLPKGEQVFVTTQGDAALHTGDLLKFIPLGFMQTRLGPPFDMLQAETTHAAESGDLLGEPEIPGTLVGTSYSANPLWNFEGALKEATASDILNVAADGKGFLVPMREYLASESFRMHPPRFIIWDFPERMASVKYDVP